MSGWRLEDKPLSTGLGIALQDKWSRSKSYTRTWLTTPPTSNVFAVKPASPSLSIAEQGDVDLADVATDVWTELPANEWSAPLSLYLGQDKTEYYYC